MTNNPQQARQWFVSTLVGGVTLYLGGFVIYGLILMDMMATDHMKDPPVMWAIPVAQLFGGAVIATILSWRGAASFLNGAKAAGCVGVLISICYSLMGYAAMDVGHTMTHVVVDAVATAVLWGLAGGVVGAVRGRGQ